MRKPCSTFEDDGIAPVMADGGPTRGHSGKGVFAQMSSKLPKPMVVVCCGGGSRAGRRTHGGLVGSASVEYGDLFDVKRVTG